MKMRERSNLFVDISDRSVLSKEKHYFQLGGKCSNAFKTAINAIGAKLAELALVGRNE